MEIEYTLKGLTGTMERMIRDQTERDTKSAFFDQSGELEHSVIMVPGKPVTELDRQPADEHGHRPEGVLDELRKCEKAFNNAGYRNFSCTINTETLWFIIIKVQ